MNKPKKKRTTTT